MSEVTRLHAVRSSRAAYRQRSNASRAKAAERAVRAARTAGLSAPAANPFRKPFVAWIVARLCALALMVLAATSLYAVATSTQFRVRAVHVKGNVLLSQMEIERSAAVDGANLFWVNPPDIESRLRGFPVIQKVVVSPSLPDSIQIDIVERQPAAVWRTSSGDLIVDSAGVVIERAEDAGGALSLPVVAEMDDQSLEPGARVDARVLAASSRLSTLLPAAGVQPSGFEWSANTGLEVSTAEGVRIRFDPSVKIEPQVDVLRSVRHYLSSAKESATLIDVRFADRPYYQ